MENSKNPVIVRTEIRTGDRILYCFPPSIPIHPVVVSITSEEEAANWRYNEVEGEIILLLNRSKPNFAWPDASCIHVAEGRTGDGTAITGFAVKNEDGSYTIQGGRIVRQSDGADFISWKPVTPPKTAVRTASEVLDLPEGAVIATSDGRLFAVNERTDRYTYPFIDALGVADETHVGMLKLPAEILVEGYNEE